MASPAIVLLVLLVCTCGVSARTLYVAADGVNTTCTQELPCSLTTACGEVEAFDLIQLLAGQYALVDSPCEIGVASVDVVGEEGSELTCTGSCFVFSESPFTISSLSLASADDTESDALIVATTEIDSPEDFASLSNLNVQLQSANFLYIDFNGILRNATINLTGIAVSGSCSSDPDSEACISISAKSLVVASITDSTFSDMTTYSNAPLIGSEVNFFYQLSLERLTFTDLNVSSVCIQPSRYTRVEDITIVNLINYYSGNVPLLEVSGTLAVVQNVSFFNVQDISGLFGASPTDLVVENLSADSCVGTDNIYAMDFHYFVSPDIVTHTAFGVSLTNSAYPRGINAQYQVNGTLVLNDLTVSNVTTTSPFFGSSDGKFVLTEFSVDESDVNYLFDAYNPTLVTVVNGTISNSNLGIAMFSVRGGENQAKMLFKDVTTDTVTTSYFFYLDTGDAIWQLNITDCVFDTGSDVAVESVAKCVSTDNDASNTVITVVSSPCDLGNTCDLTVEDGYDAGDTCTINVDASSTCPDCGDENNDDDDGDGNHPYWWIALVVIAGLAIIVIIVAVIASVGAYIAKQKKERDEYQTI